VTRRARIIAAFAAASVLLAACGIGTDDTPRDVPPAEQRQLGLGGGQGGGAAAGTARIYLLVPGAGQTRSLQAVARDVAETPDAVLIALFAGANASEAAKQFRTAIPSGERLLSSRLQGGILRVDLSNEILQLSGSDLVDAVAQIVFTASGTSGVQGVKILVAGADQQWPAGDGALQARPLTVYDYPGLVVSSQPAYPAFPTPTQPSG
jgi:germination protein M